MRVAVLAGGVAGSIGRYLIQVAGDTAGWPWGTFWANTAGAFLLGVLAGRIGRSERASLAAGFLGVGVLGAFTTFSALTAQILDLDPPVALSYATLSLVAGLAAALLGSRLGGVAA